MSNVEDAERIKLVLKELEGQYAARQFTSGRIEPPDKGCQLRVLFCSRDLTAAKIRALSIGRIAQETAELRDLEADVYGPDFVDSDFAEKRYAVSISVQSKSDPSVQRSPPPAPYGPTLTDRCGWD